VSGSTAPVAAVIVTRNSAKFLEGCLGSLRALRRPPAEIVLVDNGSEDGTPEIARRLLPGGEVLECRRNLGFCKANNLGIARTRSPYVLVLNPDTRLRSDFLEELLRAFENPRVGLAAGKLLRFDEQTLDSAGQDLGRSRQPRDRGFGERDQGQYDRDEEVFGVCGAAALYRRAMIESIADAPSAPFDEAFFAFYEDLDVAWRARRFGWKAAYRHRALGFHFRGGTSRGWDPARRFTALLRRGAEVRYHILKNRYLVILRNDSVGGYVRNLPFILARDVATLGITVLLSPGVLARLWRTRELFREALRKRRLDAARGGHHVAWGADGPPQGKGRAS